MIVVEENVPEVVETNMRSEMFVYSKCCLMLTTIDMFLLYYIWQKKARDIAVTKRQHTKKVSSLLHQQHPTNIGKPSNFC